ncbi:RHS repeat-associated core domain-containing protein [Caenimonas soli]|uniref:RHS repeat-associated core domain-containing protein n=1 Tax=Caenimonas soli TaxID=2735555 RepID=UPI001556B4D6|nr:RHS repeat-associated core domain-containing protein [Caenimonas soli]NPC59189.1 hypothetical protein [Caenimonas soli]
MRVTSIARVQRALALLFKLHILAIIFLWSPITAAQTDDWPVFNSYDLRYLWGDRYPFSPNFPTAQEACAFAWKPQGQVRQRNNGHFYAIYSYLGAGVPNSPAKRYCMSRYLPTAGGPAVDDSADYIVTGYGMVTLAEIKLRGGDHTKALPAGPALPHVAEVTQNGAPVSGKAVSILAGSRHISGVTDSAGQFHFPYIPPYTGGITEAVTASCSGCVKTAQKSVQVHANESCERKGNPILPATGEKEQIESDWADASPHGLSFTRHYRSYSMLQAGLGPRWSHNYAAGLTGGDLEAIVDLPGGDKALFRRGSNTSAWVEDSRRDSLADTVGGKIYTRAADESRWQFDAAGKLISVTQRNGWTMSLAYDSANQLTRVVNAFGRAIQFGYDAQGRLTGISTPDGKSIAYGYDGLGRLASVIYPDNGSRNYLYEDPRHTAALTGVVDEAGTRYATFTYDQAGRATSTSHTGGADSYSVSYLQGDTGSTLVAGGTVDPAIYRTTVQISDPLGTTQSYTWVGGDGQVRLSSASGAADGNQLANRSLGAYNLPERETDFLGISTAYTWDLSRQLQLSTTRAEGRPEAQTSSAEWHPSFRLPSRITEAGRSTAYSYDNLGNTLSETITDTATGEARNWRWTYNAQGLPDSMTDPKGGVWKYGYDTAGNLTSAKNPLGHEASYSYDAAGRVTSQTAPNGLITAYRYDARGRLVSQNRGGEISTFGYTPAGQLASASLPNGFQTSYSYDAAQRLIAATDNRGNSVNYTLDAMGNRIREEVKDATGNIALVTARVINSLNKVAAIQGSVGQTTQLAYDANGEPIAQTDPLNQTTRQALDGLRRTTATTFADNTSATQAWNQLDQLTKVTDPKGVATSYQTNAFGEVMSETSPDIGVMTYTRDANGEVTSIQDAKGQVNHIERDALGRPTVIEYAQGHNANFSYDAAGHVTRIEDKSGGTIYQRNAQGRILAKTQTVNDNPSSPTQLSITYGYQGGELSSIGYPSGLKVFYKRAAGRITDIDVQEPASRGKTSAVIPFVSDLTHTALGQPKSWRWNSGDAASRTFDTDGRMTQSEIASYSYDVASKITGITQSLWAQRTVTMVVNGKSQTITELYQTPISWTASYDARSRLTSFARAGAETKYSYDANSNRLTGIDQTTGDVDLEGAFDQPHFTQSASQSLNIDAASNKLLGFTQTVTKTHGGNPVSSVTSNVNYSIDANGAMTSDGLRTFEYDDSGRLAKVKIVKDGEAAAVDYMYNAIGQRVFKSEPQAEQTLPKEEDLGPGFMNWLKKQFGWMFTKGSGAKASIGMAFVYGDSEIPQWALLGEYDNGSALGKGRTEYIWLPTEDGQAIPIGLYKNGKFYSVHSDHLGTPRLMTDQDRKPLWQWPYSGFGSNRTTGPLAAITISSNQAALKRTKPLIEVNLRFAGQYFDDEDNLADNHFRLYQQTQGRYTQPDPIGLVGGWNRFSYVEGNPLMYTDPEGLVAQGIVDFGAGMGDVILFGQGQRLRDLFDVDGGIDQCSDEYSAGEWAGIAASMATGLAGGLKAAGAKGAGKEFSHWIPNRMGGPRSTWNGNFVPAATHALSDPYRYRFMPRPWKAQNPMPNAASQQWTRIPNAYKGGAAGAGYGAAGAAQTGCSCRR